MIKVIIVDDEYIERKGMEKTIEWDKYGCILCGDADNGLDGLKLACRLKPDIIIADIRMPGLDGISMLRKVKNELPYCKFIIITAYSDFEYAKEAVKISACDFLLKPINSEEFVGSIKKACKECLEIKEKIAAKTEKSLFGMLKGNISGKENVDKVMQDFPVKFDKIILSLFINNSPKKENSQHDIKSVLKKYFSSNSYIVECYENQIALISGQRDSGDMYKTIQKAQKKLKESYEIDVTVGISNSYDVYHLKNAYIEAKSALNYRIFMGRGSIINYSKIKLGQSVSWDKILRAVNSITLKLKACDKHALKEELYNLYFRLFKDANVNNSIIQQTGIEIIFRGINVMSSYHIKPDKILRKHLDIYQNILQLETLKDNFLFVENILFGIIDCIRENSALIYDDGMKKVFEYINAHFCENISLSSVSDAVYLSKSYLCTKFKKVLGISFTDYITKLRIEKSMEYLSDPNIKITEIARKVGYQDYRYYSRKFKECTGYLPSQWQVLKIKDPGIKS